MDALSDQFRAALEWKYLERLSVRDMAARWGTTEKSVESILFRARGEFRRRLKQLDDSNVWGAPVVTKIENYKKFYEAEEYHQDFMAKNPRHGYIVRWDAPKVRALREMYPEHFTSTFLRESS